MTECQRKSESLAMNANRYTQTTQSLRQRLRLHGLDVIEGREGGTAFKKLVQTRPTARPNAKAWRLPMRR